jgi:hypothetical protein
MNVGGCNERTVEDLCLSIDLGSGILVYIPSRVRTARVGIAREMHGHPWWS